MILHGFAWRSSKNTVLRPTNLKFNQNYPNNLKIIRKKNWAEKINLKILIINNTSDKVVCSKKINNMSKRLKNSKVIEFCDTEHEIFMEKDLQRNRLWETIDEFL